MCGTMADGDAIARPALPWNFKLLRLKLDWAPGDVFATLYGLSRRYRAVPRSGEVERQASGTAYAAVLLTTALATPTRGRVRCDRAENGCGASARNDTSHHLDRPIGRGIDLLSKNGRSERI